jgi:uncharacterized protein YgiM (DUF1202 family)
MMIRRFLSVLLVLITMLVIGVAVQPAAAQTNNWTAEYFNNPSLVGAPVLVLTEQTPTHEWGYNSPGANVPADYFSARWSTTAYVNGGNYTLNVKADDGVRVLVDGIVYINEWHPAAGQFYQATVPLAAGNHSFIIEFYEATEIAYMVYNFNLVGPQPPPTAPQARVTAQFLNVRSLPNAGAAILEIISQNQVYPVVGRNINSTWLQLNVNGNLGWVNASYVAATNLAGVPITDGQGGTFPTPVPLPPPGNNASVTAYLLNVRSEPNPFVNNVVTQIRHNEVYPVIGRNLDTSWLQININGLVGWVRSTWVSAPSAALAPVTSNTNNPSQPAPPPQAFATVRAYFLNVRLQPFFGSQVLTIVGGNQTYPVVGRNGDNSWVQINVGGTVGWVRSSWVIINPGLINVPVTA